MTIYKNELGNTVVELGIGNVNMTGGKESGENPKLGFTKCEEIGEIGVEIEIPCQLDENEVIIEFTNKESIRNMILELNRLLVEWNNI